MTDAKTNQINTAISNLYEAAQAAIKHVTDGHAAGKLVAAVHEVTELRKEQMSEWVKSVRAAWDQPNFKTEISQIIEEAGLPLMHRIVPIRGPKHYEQACVEIQRLSELDLPKDSLERARLELLLIITGDYERKDEQRTVFNQKGDWPPGSYHIKTYDSLAVTRLLDAVSAMQSLSRNERLDIVKLKESNVEVTEALAAVHASTETLEVCT